MSCLIMHLVIYKQTYLHVYILTKYAQILRALLYGPGREKTLSSEPAQTY